MPEVVMNYINMECFDAVNPLYAFPIVAVIVCAFIVYFFGFKSPVQPPSFEGIEEERKISKKRRAKDNQKSKSLQNGKLNENAVNKIQSNASAGKKKDAHEKSSVNADKTATHAEKKIINAEKSDTKASKKTRQQNDKKDVQVKKKDAVVPDDNDDGWVQLVSKKGRKNRKKEEASPKSENQINVGKNTSAKKVEVGKIDVNEACETIKMKPDIIEDVPTLDAKPARKVKQVKEENKKTEEIADSSMIKAKEQVEVIDVKNEPTIVEKILPVEKKNVEAKPVAKSVEMSTELEESKSKSKKKKKKSTEPVSSEDHTNVSESPAVQDVKETPTPKEAAIEVSISSTTQQVVEGNTDLGKAPEVKTTNVVFDELAGLYPEEKEQRRKKKVRRDH